MSPARTRKHHWLLCTKQDPTPAKQNQQRAASTLHGMTPGAQAHAKPWQVGTAAGEGSSPGTKPGKSRLKWDLVYGSCWRGFSSNPLLALRGLAVSETQGHCLKPRTLPLAPGSWLQAATAPLSAGSSRRSRADGTSTAVGTNPTHLGKQGTFQGFSLPAGLEATTAAGHAARDTLGLGEGTQSSSTHRSGAKHRKALLNLSYRERGVGKPRGQISQRLEMPAQRSTCDGSTAVPTALAAKHLRQSPPPPPPPHPSWRQAVSGQGDCGSGPRGGTGCHPGSLVGSSPFLLPEGQTGILPRCSQERLDTSLVGQLETARTSKRRH